MHEHEARPRSVSSDCRTTSGCRFAAEERLDLDDRPIGQGGGSDSVARSDTASVSDPMFTTGYQGASLERLVGTLAAADVSVLVDTTNPELT